MFNFLKKTVPYPLLSAYHWLLAFLGALIYGFPSRGIFVIGVTGTKGKTTTCNLISQMLESSGFKVGMATTVNFKIGEKEWKNETKQTMLGRFQLQKLIRKMKKRDCSYAIIETSSEGILQHRHRFIDYDMAVFTNITPEHIERHGGFENYRKAKVKLFEKVAKKESGIGVYNLDDENAKYFLKPGVKIKYGFSINQKSEFSKKDFEMVLEAQKIKLDADGSEFEINGADFKTDLPGEFNVYNFLAAFCAVLPQGANPAKIKELAGSLKLPPGRMETIKSKKGFGVIIDYAHEPASLEAVYKTVRSALKPKRMICLLGGQGGGRDKWKRRAMGALAGAYCDEIILANEDPYDEAPENIINDIEAGCLETKKSGINIEKITDRKEAIKKAVSLARKRDAVVLTGKGGEVWMCVENGKKIPWDEKGIVEKYLSFPRKRESSQ
jgi:UDP-N-acetylmuramoyl-L-alanyl-D-glutamate--2,6-diaminopimelate ligase